MAVRSLTHSQHPVYVGRLTNDSPKLDGDGRIREGGIDVVNGYGIERIGGVAADIHDEGQPPRLTRRFDLFFCDERRDGRGEVDAVDEDINVQDFLERATLGRLRQVPFEDVIPEVTRSSASILATLHQRTYSSRPILRRRSTAPRPHRPRAPITRALTPFPLPPRTSLTWFTIAVSLW